MIIRSVLLFVIYFLATSFSMSSENDIVPRSNRKSMPIPTPGTAPEMTSMPRYPMSHSPPAYSPAIIAEPATSQGSLYQGFQVLQEHKLRCTIIGHHLLLLPDTPL